MTIEMFHLIDLDKAASMRRTLVVFVCLVHRRHEAGYDYGTVGLCQKRGLACMIILQI